MPRLARIESHFTAGELLKRFRDCDDATEKIHWQAVLLRTQGRSTAEVAAICGYKVDWVRRLVRRYNAHGADGLRDGHRNNGKKPMMGDAQMEELRNAVLQETPPGGGLWTGPKVAQWMTVKLNRTVSPQRAWDYLQRLRMSKQTPRPRHARASTEDQEDFKKNSVAVWR